MTIAEELRAIALGESNEVMQRLCACKNNTWLAFIDLVGASDPWWCNLTTNELRMLLLFVAESLE